eukprot:12546455-Prorocentrum_lima.AAC.1
MGRSCPPSAVLANADYEDYYGKNQADGYQDCWNQGYDGDVGEDHYLGYTDAQENYGDDNEPQYHGGFDGCEEEEP